MSSPVEGLGGLQKVVLTSSSGGSTAEVYLYGAHVTSWKVDGKELLFVSKEAILKPPKAIRGGIPVCWPQFSDFGPLQSHGFARNSTFQLRSCSGDSATLALTPGEDAPKGFPHAFELLITVTVQETQLRQEVRVMNNSAEDFEFTAALHTYFRTVDIGQVAVQGLGEKPYLDNLDSRNRFQLPAGELRFDREVDRIFVDVPTDITIADGAAQHTITVHRTGFPDAVVWNPWIDKAKSTGDFGDEEYKEMVCVEAALAPTGPAKVQPGAGNAWTAFQTLVYSASS